MRDSRCRAVLAMLRAPFLAAGLIAAVGCGSEAPDDNAPSVVRLLPETSRGPLQPATFGDRVQVFDGVLPAAGWVPMGPAGSWREEHGSLVVESGGDVFDLERPEVLQASALHVLEVTLASGYKVDLSLSWRRESGVGWDEPGGPSLELGYNEGRGQPHHKTFTFDLSAHRGWSGTVSGLRLRLEPAREDERIVVSELLGTRRSLSDETLAEDVLHSWTAELDREVREVLVVAPGHPVERALQVPENSTLEFGLGVTGRLSSPVTVRVTASRQEHGKGQVLFESRLEPVEWAAARRWQEASVDLSSLGGEDARLRFESLAGPGFDPAFGLPVMAHPEIVQAPVGTKPANALDRPNIILLSIDTLRADHLSLYGYPNPTSANLDAWADRFAVTFNNAVAQAPWTLPSHSSLLSGIGPLRHGVNHPFRAAPAELTTIAERLHQAGYFTAAITGGGWLNPRYGLAQGYDRYRYWIGTERGGQELETQAVIASQWLDELREPFFLFLHSYDVHDFNSAARQRDPGRSVAPATDDPPSDLVAAYDRAVAHMDQQVGDFLAAFSASGLRGRTILALTSDHGEDLGEDAVYGHGSLRDQVLLVPLIVELPDGRGAGSKIDDQVRSIDLVPTLLDTAGLDVPTGLDGVSLSGLVEGDSTTVPSIASSYFALQHGISLRFGNRWKYTYDSSVWKAGAAEDGREALYELPGGEDSQRDNLAPGHLRTASFRALARELLRERLGGLTMRFKNATSEPLYGTLRGDLIRVGAPKSLDLSEPWLTRSGDDVAHFSLPPGQQFQLLFERIGRPHFEVLAASSDSVLAIDLETLALPSTLVWTGSRWELEAGVVALAGAAGIVLEQHLGGAIEDAAPLDLDDGLRRQLEALGYLD